MTESKSYPFTWTKCTEEEQKEYASIYHENSFYRSMMKSSPMNVMLPQKFEKFAEKIWNFTPREDDIWVVTYPKCGTTLTQEIVWQMVNGFGLNDEESTRHIFLRSPFFEISMLAVEQPFLDAEKLDDFSKMMIDSVSFTEQLKSPRIIKSHLPMAMLPPNLVNTAKVLYVSRNPKDAAVSFIHMDKIMPHHGMRNDYGFEEYATNLYMNGKVVYGSYWEHVNDAWTYRDNPNFKFVWYEDMVKDLPKAIQDIADFTNQKVSGDQIEKLVDHCNIDNFKKNDAVNMKPPKGAVPDELRDNFQFIRKGGAGGWKSHFKEESNLKKFDEWIAKNNKFDIPITFA